MNESKLSISVSEWIGDMRSEGSLSSGLLLGIYYAYVGAWLTFSTRTCLETNVFERDWDILLLLDTCRVDALKEVKNEYKFIESIDSIWSVGSTSGEWVARTFDKRYLDQINETAYVTANPHSNTVLRKGKTPPQYVASPISAPVWNHVSPEAFELLDEVWEYAADETLGVVPPQVTTDKAITAARESKANRLIVHYMQPHEPYLVDGKVWKDPIDDLQAGKATKEEVWAAYLDNLRRVLDEVELLLENADAERVIISADHGELFGEWHNYGHPVGMPHPAVKRVPWVETTAEDTGEYEPATHESSASDSTSVQSQLESLGYL